ncbi:MAG: pyridoxamine 5'-phosphate oxidase [Gemmatimonadota bacterium]|nr:pyridoxamine 5'-phosphate oxidase [Gemmatimonadota bacterium]
MSLKSSIKTVLTLGKGIAGGMPEAAEDADPIELFHAWYGAAEESGIVHPEAMALATATPEGRPSVRMVLLKELDERGFVFFTNYESRKAEELDANAHAALCFHWGVHARQVRVTGSVARTSDEESFEYFRTRARGSRIGAWASEQSRPLDARATLEARVREMKERFGGDEIPLPPYWGGYRLVPDTIEFWQGRADRLHDRLVFTRASGGWSAQRLYP